MSWASRGYVQAIRCKECGQVREGWSNQLRHKIDNPFCYHCSATDFMDEEEHQTKMQDSRHASEYMLQIVDNWRYAAVADNDD